MSILMSILLCLDYCSFIIKIQIQLCSPILNVLAILGLLYFHVNFRITLSHFQKDTRIFIGIVNSTGQFRENEHFNNNEFSHV